MTEFDTALTAQTLAAELAKAGVPQSRLQPWPSPAPAFADGVVMVGPGQPAVEVAVLPQRSTAPKALMRDVWHARQAGRPNPVVLVAVGATQNGAGVRWVGPDAASLDVLEMEWTTARSLIAGAAEQPAGPAAVRYLIERLPRDGKEGIPGINNLGMFAAHALIERARDFQEWQSSVSSSKTLRAKSGRALVEALGYTVEQTGQVTEVLRSEDDRATAIAVFLDQGEAPDASAARFGGQTPVGAALARAERDNIPFVLITRGRSIRLHVTGRLQGVGRKGPAETLVQADMSLLREEHLPYVPLIFGAKALADGGSFERLLSLSRDYSAALSTRLRERIYTDVVPTLAVGLANARGDGVDLDDIYEETLVLLFRLLFVAYAEDRDLLPYRTNKRYRDASLKAMARSLADIVEEGRSFENDETDGLWEDCFQLFSAVDKGSPTWDVPAYNGGLFSNDEAVNEAGTALASVTLPNHIFGPALTFLLTEPGADDGVAGPVDFRSLSVRDFGTIYEGLLESGISEATEDLALDATDNYVPAGTKEPAVRAGDIYHHNRGGARKSTGSYFTRTSPSSICSTRRSYQPSTRICSACARLYDTDAAAAAEAFFDFRCADIAMGSGHFLVAAVDKIEARFSRFLDDHPVPGVLAELDRLRDAARKGLGDSADLTRLSGERCSVDRSLAAASTGSTSTDRRRTRPARVVGSHVRARPCADLSRPQPRARQLPHRHRHHRRGRGRARRPRWDGQRVHLLVAHPRPACARCRTAPPARSGKRRHAGRHERGLRRSGRGHKGRGTWSDALRPHLRPAARGDEHGRDGRRRVSHRRTPRPRRRRTAERGACSAPPADCLSRGLPSR